MRPRYKAPGDRAKPQGALLLSQHLLDDGAILPTTPDAPCLRMHPVDEEMHMRMPTIAMRYDED